MLDGNRLRQAAQQTFHILARVGTFRVVLAEHERRLRHVGQNDVRLGAKPLHRRRECLVENGIKLAAVRHHRVDDEQRILVRQGGESIADKLDLLERAEKARVDAVEFQTKRLPMRDHRRDVLSQVTIGEAREAARMRRQDRRRQHRALDARRRYDRQGHRQRALPHARNIMNRQDSLLSFHFYSLFSIFKWERYLRKH